MWKGEFLEGIELMKFCGNPSGWDVMQLSN
jgi:hypothetical protein